MTVRFVHAADLHLDFPFVGLREADAQVSARLQEATLTAFDRVVEVCLNEQVDFAIFAGDVFDGEHRSLRGQFRFAEGLRRLSEAGIRSFIAHGNHDPWEDWSPRLRWPALAHRFGCDEAESIAVQRDGETVCQVYGISFRKREVTENLAQRFRRDDDAPLAVGVLHADVGGRQGQSAYAPCSLEDLRAVKFDYWALGHIHTSQVLRAAEPCIVYAGNTQGLNPNETEPRGCYVVTLEANRPPGLEFRPTCEAEWQHVAAPIEGIDDEQQLPSIAEELIDEVRRSSKAGLLLVRLFLTGAGPLHRWLLQPGNRGELLETVRDVVGRGAGDVWIESAQDETRTPIDLSAWAEGEDFVGEFLRLAEAAKADDGVPAELREELASLLGRKEVDDALRPQKAPREAPTISDDDLRGWLEAARTLGAERLIGEGGEA